MEYTFNNVTVKIKMEPTGRELVFVGDRGIRESIFKSAEVLTDNGEVVFYVDKDKYRKSEVLPTDKELRIAGVLRTVDMYLHEVIKDILHE